MSFNQKPKQRLVNNSLQENVMSMMQVHDTSE